VLKLLNDKKATMMAGDKENPNKQNMPPQFFDDEVSLELRGGVALLTFVGAESSFPWGTKREEHRWNPVTVRAFDSALDAVEKDQEAKVLVVTNVGKFWSNGFDLKFVDVHGDQAKDLGDRLNELMTRVCCFPLPTIAAINGHFCAAGGMMGLAFDYRVMSNDRGFFFIPGVDLGLVYSPLQTALMTTKLPKSMHRDVILFNAKRWNAKELLDEGAIDGSVPSVEVVSKAFAMAESLKPKGSGAARKVLGGIKRRVYKDVIDALATGGEMDTGARSKGVDRPSKL